MRFDTLAIHAGVEPDPTYKSIMTPIHLTSTFVQEELGKSNDYAYSRVSNPTRTAVEQSVAALEHGVESLAFASGMAAIDTLFRLLKTGDHVLLSNNLYGGTYRLGKLVLNGYGIEFECVDTDNLKAVEAAVKPNTRMVFVETPTNPTMQITDLAAVAALCKRLGLISAVDNTFATPYFQNPLDLGMDIVVHSATKYLNGHSDMLGGFLVLRDATHRDRLRFLQKAVGAILSPFESWMCLRGIKTLPVRMERHNANGMKISQFLSSHPAVRKVYYPGLPAHPGHELAKKQMRGFGGMLSFDLGGYEKAKKFLDSVKLCALAESLGGVETLLAYPATMTHASVPKEERERNGITDGLVRISVGLEDAADIIDDIQQALV